MVVEHGGEQVVRRADGVKVAGEVQVDVLHRHDLRVAAAGRAALASEYRAERRLATAASFPMRRSASARPMVVVVLPSPAGVGVMAVTRTNFPFPRGGCPSTDSATFAL